MDMERFKERLREAVQDEDIRQMLADIRPGPDGGEERLTDLEGKYASLCTALEEVKAALAVRESARAGQETAAQAQVRQLEDQLRAVRQENAELDRRTHESERAREALDRRLQDTSRRAEELERQCARLAEEGQTLRSRLAAAEKEAGERERQLQAERERAERLSERLDRSEEAGRPFQPLLRCCEGYRALPEGLLRALSPILSADDPVRFWVGGCQSSVLLLVWDTVKRQLEELTPETVAAVTEILGFFIDRYNSIWNAPVYELMTNEAGRPFDQLRHLRSGDCSRYQGDVKRVVLPGIWNLNRNAAERKCVVWY